jgi:hypothetical protein
MMVTSINQDREYRSTEGFVPVLGPCFFFFLSRESGEEMAN